MTSPGGAVVLDLCDIRSADSGRVGPKVARLGQLAAAGWQVPDGYAVTVDALGRWLPAAAQAELTGMFDDPDGDPDVHRLSARAQALIESQPLPPWLSNIWPALPMSTPALPRPLPLPPAGPAGAPPPPDAPPPPPPPPLGGVLLS